MTEKFDASAIGQVEEWISIGFDDYHESWKNKWGKSIESEELREIILSVPRLAKRIEKDILELAESELGRTSSDTEVFTSTDVNMISTYTKNVRGKGYVDKVGLAWHANTIRYLLNGPSSHELLSLLGKNAIRTSLSYLAIATAPQYTEVKIQEIPTLVRKDGLNCLLCWAEQYSRQVASRLVVLLPRKENRVDMPSETKKQMIALVNNILVSEKR